MLVVTWNVNGLRARFAEVTELVRDVAPDVLCLQEIKASPAQVPEPLTGLPDYYNHYHGAAGGYSGVSIHVRRSGGAGTTSEAPSFDVPSFDFETRIVVARLAGGRRIASVYVPNGAKDYRAKLRFLTGLAEWAEGRDDLIVAGDLNVALTDADVHSSMKKASAIGQRPDERALLSRIIDSGHRDVLREAHPDAGDVFTWWAPWRDEKAKNRGWRIDFVLAPDRLASNVTSVEILKDFGSSDHAPLAVRFET